MAESSVEVKSSISDTLNECESTNVKSACHKMTVFSHNLFYDDIPRNDVFNQQICTNTRFYDSCDVTNAISSEQGNIDVVSHYVCSQNSLTDDAPVIQNAGTTNCSSISDSNHISTDSMEPKETFHDLKQYKLSYDKGLMTAYININSLTKCFEEFHDMMKDGLVDIISFGESKLDDSVTDHVVSVPGFKLYRKDVSRIAHGIVTYVRSDIIHFRRAELEVDQSIVIEVRLGKEKWFFVSMYRPPSSCENVFITSLIQLCDKLLVETNNLVVLGDLNINMMASGNSLSNFCDLYDMTNLVKEPTCFKSLNNPSLIDVILATQPKRFHKYIAFDTGLSDYHKMICISTKIHAPIRVPRKIKYRSFKNFSNDKYCEEVNNIPFHAFECFEDPDDIAWAYETALLDVIDTHAPIKQRTLKKDSAPFMNSKLRKVINRRNQLKNKFWKRKTKSNWEAYRVMRNKANAINRQSQINYFNTKCLKAERSRDFWSTFKPYLSKKGSSSNLITLKEGDTIISRPKDVCNTFSKYYETIADGIGEDDGFDFVNEDEVRAAIAKHDNHSSSLLIREKCRTPPKFKFSQVESDEVMKYMKAMKFNKSPGYDNIAPIFLKSAAKQLANPLTRLINVSLISSKFPQTLKIGETSPIFKAKEQHRKENYRPVSCLTSISKIYEAMISRQINNHFDSIFSNKLSAFRKNYCTQHVLMNATDEWKLALDSQQCVGTILMDFSKAFDCLPHKLMISKLHAYGFDLSACTLIATYLSNRLQRVKHYGAKSDWYVLGKGVPQGSILGPLIFNIFLNDLLWGIEGRIYNYADDNTIAIIGDNAAEVKDRLTKTSELCLRWFLENMLKANPTKFQFMVLDKYQDVHHSVTIEGHHLPSVKSVKLLGVTLDSKLNYVEHSSMLCRSASRNLNILRRVSHFMQGKQEKLAMISAFVTSLFSYCPLIWHFGNMMSVRKIEKIYERSLRLVTKDYSSNYEKLLASTNCNTLVLSRLKCLAIHMYKCYYNLVPAYVNVFSKRNSQYDLRDELQYDLYRFKTKTHGYRTILYAGAKLWNSLPVKFKRSKDLNEFKNCLTTWNCKVIGCERCQGYMYH